VRLSIRFGLVDAAMAAVEGVSLKRHVTGNAVPDTHTTYCDDSVRNGLQHR
jgi:hypothetical protein